MSKFDDALFDLKSAVFAEFSDVWHHLPQKKPTDVNDVSQLDTSRPEANFCGIFFAPPSMQDINSMIGASVNMPTLEVKKSHIIAFKKNDFVVNEKNDIYQISSIKETTRFTNIIELKYIGNQIDS